tara:strand:+ start:644 stop:877 length:234 start_codon:yes stop_codon:yes gene_type:complete
VQRPGFRENCGCGVSGGFCHFSYRGLAGLASGTLFKFCIILKVMIQFFKQLDFKFRLKAGRIVILSICCLQKPRPVR